MSKLNNIIPFQKSRFTETMNNKEKIAFTNSTPGSIYESIESDAFAETGINYNETIDEEFMGQKAVIPEKTINIFLASIAVTIAILAIIVSIAAWTIDKSINAVNSNLNSKFDSINTEIKAINQRLDYQEKMNTLMIENEVNKKINHIVK